MRRLASRLFALAELSEREIRSSALLRGCLARRGFRVQGGVAGLPTAFVARRRVGRGGPRVGLLAEYDALPKIGHACGHHLIGASACGAAILASRLQGSRPGEILVFGTPAEETIGGKVVMTRAGLFDDLDAALMVHPSTEDRVETTSLACHSLEVTYHGRAAHAVSSPHLGVNALHALLRLFRDLETLQRRLRPRGVLMPGIVAEGGLRPNIVPDRAVGRFTLRAPDRATLARAERAFRETARSSASPTGARVVVRPVDEVYAEMRTNRTLADCFRRELRRLGRRTVEAPRRTMGSLDMGNVSHVAPSVHAYVAVAPRSAPLHSAAFARFSSGAPGRAGLSVATLALAATVCRLFADGDLRARAMAEFRGGSAASPGIPA